MLTRNHFPAVGALLRTFTMARCTHSGLPFRHWTIFQPVAVRMKPNQLAWVSVLMYSTISALLIPWGVCSEKLNLPSFHNVT